MLKSIVASTLLILLAFPAIARAEDVRDYRGIRAALARSDAPPRLAVRTASLSAIGPARRQAVVKGGQRDSVWDGLLIGAGIGAVGGYQWGRHICGSNDSECFAIAGTVGVLGGIAIGATIGAVVDRLHN
jgi:hypothetical protein